MRMRREDPGAGDVLNSIQSCLFADELRRDRLRCFQGTRRNRHVLRVDAHLLVEQTNEPVLHLAQAGIVGGAVDIE